MLITADFPQLKQYEQTFLASLANASTQPVSLSVQNVTGFNVSDFIIIGKLGLEQTELTQITSINSVTNTIIVKSLVFSHPIDCTVTQTPVNQVNFYADRSGGTNYSLLTTINMEVNYPYGTRYNDLQATSSSNYVVTYFNSSTGYETDYSSALNALTGIVNYSLRGIQDRTYIQINDPGEIKANRQQLTTWANEWYTQMQIRLRELDNQFGLSTYNFPIVGSQELYNFPADFAQIFKVSINNSLNPFILDYRDFAPQDQFISSQPYYYIFGNQIGFKPVPGSATLYYYTIPATLVNDGDTLAVPFQQYSDVVVNYIVFRFMLINKPEEASTYKQIYEEQTDFMLNQLRNRQVQYPNGVAQTNPSYVMSLPEDVI